MPRKPTETNRLRGSVAPNTLRGFDTPAGSWLANGATESARSSRGAPAAPRAGRRARRSIGPRIVGRIGLLLAVAGVLPFLNAEFRWQEVGLGLMCAGVGLVLLAAFSRILRSKAATGRSGSSLLGVVLAASRGAAVAVIAGCLLLVGAFLIADAVARG